jgi:hypothetical protein
MKKQRVNSVLVLLFLLPAVAPASVINSTTISGSQLTITGTGFSGTPLTVIFNGKNIPIVSSSATQIVATLNPLPAPGSYRLVVKTGSASTFAYVTAPAIPAIVAQVGATETGLVSSTTIFTPQVYGLYRITLYMVEPVSPTNEQCATSPLTSCGTVNPDFRWTDDGGNQEKYGFSTPPYGLYLWNCSASAPQSCGNALSESFLASVDAGTPLVYSILGSDNGATYELFITVEQLM